MNYRAIILSVCLGVLTIVSVPSLFAAGMANEQMNQPDGDSIRLRLLGTALTDNPSDSIAVFETGGNGRQRIYREGDLAGGMRIKEILYDRVIVQTSQGEKTLTITGSVFSIAESPVTAEDPVQVSHGPRPPKTRRHDTRYLGQGSVSSLLADIDNALQTVDIETVTVYGRPAGVKISPIEPGSIFSIAGLRNGEVIQEVNGAEVSHPDQVIAIFQQLKEGASVDIKVKGRRTRQIHLIRDGSP